MRTAVLLAFIVSACSGTSPGLDAGATCQPPPTGTQTCATLDGFYQCLSTEAAERQSLCDLATSRPEVVSSFTCREGIDWRLALPGNPETCTYAQGVLVGATYESNGRQSVSGAWAPHDCVQSSLCPERDAGTCVPRSNANRPCDEDVSHFPFCKATEAAQRAMLCTVDAGSYSRAASVCDGGLQLTDVHTGLGPTDSCFYADGGLIGATSMDDTLRGAVYGVWSLEGCTPTQLCP